MLRGIGTWRTASLNTLCREKKSARNERQPRNQEIYWIVLVILSPCKYGWILESLRRYFSLLSVKMAWSTVDWGYVTGYIITKYPWPRRSGGRVPLVSARNMGTALRGICTVLRLRIILQLFCQKCASTLSLHITRTDRFILS